MEPGTRLGPYEMQEPLGAGGMGEVYLALDTRLDRKVAVKVLPEAFARDPERLARFEREARAAAALNHPNIAVVHDIGADGDTHYMVQEYLQGQTLREALSAGAVPLKKALAIGGEVAEALRAAHSAGVVHRDLKPDNIFLSPDGHAKILDFGLAKLVETGPMADASLSPTVIGTMAGTIMGTAGYMAPEQIQGVDVDRRADLFAFGCVLYEMVTGRRAFVGQSLPDTLSRILHQEPEPPGAVAELPPELQRIIAKCLRKDPAERYQHADDLVVDVRTVDPTLPLPADSRAPGTTDLVGRRPGGFLWVAAVAIAAILGAVAGRELLAPSAADRPLDPVRALVGFEPASSLAAGRPVSPEFALSPDGGSVVFAARMDPDDETSRQLFRRELSGSAAQPLRGTEGARWPFFAPDGQRVGFVEGVREESGIRSVPIGGGLPTTHVENLWPFGVTWGDDGYIYYTPDYRSGIWRVAAAGGAPEVVAELERGDYSYRHARLLPDTDLLVYVALEGPDMCRWQSSRIMARSLTSGEAWLVHEGGADPRLLPTGHLMFNSGTSLMAVLFDQATGRAAGTPTPVLDNVMASQCGPVPFVEFGMAMVDVATDGKLLYLTGGLLPAQRLELVAESAGGASSSLSGARVALSPRVAPDGRRVLVGSPQGLLLIDPERGQADITISDGHFAIFSHDGERVAYMAANTIGRRSSDGTGEAEVLLEVSTETYAADWASDGTLLLVRSEGEVSRRGWGIWALDPDGAPDGDPAARLRRLLGDEGSQSYPALSPDERWLAYTEGVGDTRVFITSYPALEGRYLVGAGRAPAWSADGRTLYVENSRDTFREARQAMLVRVDVTDPRSPGIAEDFMPLRRYAWSSPVRGYDVFPDGRIVYPQLPQASLDEAADTVPTHMQLVVNWFTELERLVPTGR